MGKVWARGEPFYRSEHDRFRLIELIFERERKAQGLTHQKLAERCDTPYIRVYHLTSIQNLARTIGDPRHQSDRTRILMALTWGLQLPKWKVDLLLALFDGSPLSPVELQRYLSTYDQRDTADDAETYTSADFRGAVLRAMGEFRDPDTDLASVKVSISDARLGSALRRARASFEVESQPGMRLHVKAAPASHTTPPPSFEEWVRSFSNDEPETESSSEPDLREAYAIQCQRYRVALDHLEAYGQVAIHARPTLQSWLRQERTAAQLREQLAGLTNLLWKYDDFQVGLADSTPALELKIIGFDGALMIGAGSFPGWGSWPLMLHWKDPKAVLMFAADFWENFDRIPRRDRDKSSVIEQLCALAELPHPRDRPA